MIVIKLKVITTIVFSKFCIGPHLKMKKKLAWYSKYSIERPKRDSSLWTLFTY